MIQKKITFTRIKNDVNGNPCYVVHYLDLLTKQELDMPIWSEETGERVDKYSWACKRAKAFGGRKYHTTAYGGGIVFSSYNLAIEVEEINHLTGKNYTGYVVE